MSVPTDQGVAVLETLLAERFSCRAFRSDPLDDATIDRLLTLAQRAPSWCNSQPWQTIVTQGEATDAFRERLLEAAQTQVPASDVPGPSDYLGVYRDRRRAAGFGMYQQLGIERDDRDGRRRQELENFRLFGAPHVAIVTSDRTIGPYGYVDAGVWLTAFLLAAQSLGVAAVPQAAIAMYSDVVREHFAVPDDRVVLFGVSFGLADEDHPVNGFRTDRATLDQAVTFVGR